MNLKIWLVNHDYRFVQLKPWNYSFGNLSRYIKMSWCKFNIMWDYFMKFWWNWVNLRWNLGKLFSQKSQSSKIYEHGVFVTILSGRPLKRKLNWCLSTCFFFIIIFFQCIKPEKRIKNKKYFPSFLPLNTFPDNFRYFNYKKSYISLFKCKA